MHEFENDSTIDDQKVEITDLDPIEKPSRFSSMFETLEKHPSFRQRLWRVTIVSFSVLLIVLVLFSTFPSIRSLPSNFLARVEPPKATAQVSKAADSYMFNPDDEFVWSHGGSSPFIPSANLGPAPRNCPAISHTYPFGHKDTPRVAGSYPVLVIGFGGTDAVLTNFKHAQPPEIGWYKPLFLLSETNYAGTVTFRGGEIRDGTPIWFGMKQHNQGPITKFTVLPLNSGVSNLTGSDEEWSLSTATIYIAKSGCYFLMATWPEGGWVVYFSAGS